MKQTIEDRTKRVVKTTIQKLIKNISIIAVFVAIILITISQLGLKFEGFKVEFVIEFVAQSLLLCFSCIIIFELWIKSGVEEASNESEYINLLNKYKEKSAGLNNVIMQEFLDYEKKRRYDIEYKRLSREIENAEQSIRVLENYTDEKDIKLNKFKLKCNKKILRKLVKERNSIYIDMPYIYSEQFDQLRYPCINSKYKEFKPNDTIIYMRKNRTGKYIKIMTATLIGINLFMPQMLSSVSNWLGSLFTIAISIAGLIGALVSGFGVGYNSISKSSVGVYTTALSFIEKAETWSANNNKQLRVISCTEIEADNIKKPVNEEPTEIKKSYENPIDIFNNLLK